MTFVDKARRACGLIEENLDQLGVPENRTEIFSSEAGKFLIRNPDREWDVIFYDPPYAESYDSVLEAVGSSDSPAISEGGVLVVEHHAKNFIPDEVGEMRRWRLLKQGETCLSFFEKN